MFRVTLIAALLLVGCSQAAEHETTPRLTAADRKAFSEHAKSLPPDTHTYQVQGNQLLVVDVPVDGTAKRVESQKCFVWRDQEFKTASIQCPADTPGDLAIQGGPEQETNQP
jgi:outer membrane biogenesis lipoprotein LolB